jgi:hypothetical protein
MCRGEWAVGVGREYVGFLGDHWKSWGLLGLAVCSGCCCRGTTKGFVACAWTEGETFHSSADDLLQFRDLLASAPENETGCYRDHEEG